MTDTKTRAAANGNGAAENGLQIVVPGFEPVPGESEIRNGVRQMRAGLSQLLQGKKDDRAIVVQRQQQELAAIAKRHKDELRGMDDDIAVLQSSIDGLSGKAAPALKSIAPPKRKVQPRRVGRTTESGTATGFGLSLEAAATGAKALLKLTAAKEKAGEKGTFTQKEFYRYDDLDWDQSKGSQAIRFYRAIGFIRRAGKQPKGGELWAIMDAGAVEREVRLAEERTQQFQQGALAIDEPVPPRERVLNALSEHGQITGYPELARLTGIPKGSLSALVKVLEDENAINVKRGGKTVPIVVTHREA